MNFHCRTYMSLGLWFQRPLWELWCDLGG